MHTNQVNSVSGIVLAGGLSTRMGRDKALLPLAKSGDGLTMLARAEQVLRQAGVDDVHISRNQVPYIHDNFPNRGPLAGIEAALAHCKHDCVIVVPVDMPNLTAQALEALTHSSSCCAYLAPSALPCKLPVNRVLAHRLASWLSNTEERCSIQRLLNALDATPVTDIDPMTLINTNTPEEWRRYEQSL